MFIIKMEFTILKKYTSQILRSFLLFLVAPLALTVTEAAAFQSGPGATGCAAGECRDCHNLSRKEVATLLKAKESDIVSIGLSDVPGLWEVELFQNGKTFPVMVDFSKEFLVQGQVFRLIPPKDTKKSAPPKTIDLSKIPLDDALLLGRADATRKIIVFDDPECPFCAALEPEMQATVKAHPEVAFLIKLFPLTKIHPNAYEKARAIFCAKSLSMFEDSLAGKPVPAPKCETEQIKQNLELGKGLGIFSTPTMIMPDGRIVPGAMSADNIFRTLNGEEIKVEAKTDSKGEAKKAPKAEAKKDAKPEAKKSK